MRDADLAAISTAWITRDRDALVEHGARIGLALDLERLQALRTHSALTEAQVIATLHAALVEGVALREVIDTREWQHQRVCCLAVRVGGELAAGVAAVGKQLGVGHAWPELKPWFKQLARNHERLQHWASSPERVRIPILEIPSAETIAGEAALMAQIVERPEDPAPRAVLADALLERDDVRGELIRLSERLRELRSLDPDYEAVASRIHEIVEQHGPTLAGEVAEHAAAYTFVDGMVDSVTMSAGAFRKHGERLFRAQPIRKLIVKPFNTTAIATLAKCPHLGLVRALELATGGIGHERSVDLTPLVAVLAQLEELELASCLVAGADGERFFARLAAPRLRRIRVVGGIVGARALRGFAANRSIGATLAELELFMVRRTGRLEPKADEIADEAFASFELPRLRRLELGDCWFLTDARIAALVRRAPALEELQAEGAAVRTMTAVATCRHLERLTLPGTIDGSTLARVLALPALRSIFVADAGMTPDDVTRLGETLLALPVEHPLRGVYFAGEYFQRLMQRFPG